MTSFRSSVRAETTIAVLLFPAFAPPASTPTDTKARFGVFHRV